MSPKPGDGVERPPSPPVERSQDSTPPIKTPPAKPNPAADPKLAVPEDAEPDWRPISSPQLNALPDDIFQIPALAALKLLSASVEALTRLTGDIPPTPPPNRPHVPHMKGMVAEKENIVRNHSANSLSKLREQALKASGGSSPLARNVASVLDENSRDASARSSPREATMEHLPARTRPSGQRQQLSPPEEIDGVQLRTTSPPIRRDPETQIHAHMPPPPQSTPEPYIVIGHDCEPLNSQHSVLTRKFYSKQPPPIGISDYLLRIHRFCPMSTAVYLATSIYIHRLAIDERAIAVTKRNAHRLILAGLRVAMKALEDMSFPHVKVARVGGVSELELARLEISFCFLCGFELVISPEIMTNHWMVMRSGPGVESITPLDGVIGGDGGVDGAGNVVPGLGIDGVTGRMPIVVEAQH